MITGTITSQRRTLDRDNRDCQAVTGPGPRISLGSRALISSHGDSYFQHEVVTKAGGVLDLAQPFPRAGICCLPGVTAHIPGLSLAVDAT